MKVAQLFIGKDLEAKQTIKCWDQLYVLPLSETYLVGLVLSYEI